MAKKKVTKSKAELEPELSKTQLKQKITELEIKYKESFKSNSCKEIMNAYQALSMAKKKYYKATDNRSFEEQVMDEVIKQMSSKDEFEM